MSKNKEQKVGYLLPDYFYYNGILYNIVGNTITTIKEFEGVPPTSLGLVATDELSNRTNYLQGRILTIIDATFADKDQKKAIKDLIKQVMFEEHSRLEDSATGFQTISTGDMIQYSGSVDKFYEENQG